MYLSDVRTLSPILVASSRNYKPFDVVVAADRDFYPDIDVEYNAENWGKFRGNVVCVDYGLPEKQMIADRCKYLRRFPGDHRARQGDREA